MDKRQVQKKEKKQIVKREQNRSYRIFIFSIIISIVNYVFWHDQFIGLDKKHTILFVIVPLILGCLFFYYVNKFFIKSILETKSSGLKDTILSHIFLAIIGLVFSYFSMVTLANVIFKLSMESATENKMLEYKTYKVESTFKMKSVKSFSVFSTIYYYDEKNEIQIFKVPVNAVTTSNENRKIIFTCQKGFWGYYKILDYKIQ